MPAELLTPGPEGCRTKGSSDQSSFSSPCSSQVRCAAHAAMTQLGTQEALWAKLPWCRGPETPKEGKKHPEEPQSSHCCPGYRDWRALSPAQPCCLCLGSLPSLREPEMRVQAQDSAHMNGKRRNDHTGMQGWEMWAGQPGMVTFSSSTDHLHCSRLGGSGFLRGRTAQPSPRGAQKMLRDAAAGGSSWLGLHHRGLRPLPGSLPKCHCPQSSTAGTQPFQLSPAPT